MLSKNMTPPIKHLCFKNIAYKPESFSSIFLFKEKTEINGK